MLLNLDAGEHDDEPEELWQLFDVLDVACGGHAGDTTSMTRVVGFWANHGRRQIGAHPSYPDREGFGRRSIAMPAKALAAAITEQCVSLAQVTDRYGVTIVWVKPHGALYHDAARNPAIAEAVVSGATEALGESFAMIGPPNGALREATLARGLAYLREGFADRRMRDDGTLVARSEADALILDPARAAAQALALANAVDTICVHADTPGALAIARAVREALDG